MTILSSPMLHAVPAHIVVKSVEILDTNHRRLGLEIRTLILFLLMSKSKFPIRDADRYCTMDFLPGGNQNSTSSTNCKQNAKFILPPSIRHWISHFTFSIRQNQEKQLGGLHRGVGFHIPHGCSHPFSLLSWDYNCQVLLILSIIINRVYIRREESIIIFQTQQKTKSKFTTWISSSTASSLLTGFLLPLPSLGLYVLNQSHKLFCYYYNSLFT